MMTEEMQQHLDGFRSAVQNNQLYLAIQHLLEVVDPLVEKVFDEDNISEPDKNPKAAPEPSGKGTSAPRSSTRKKAKKEDTEDEEVSN